MSTFVDQTFCINQIIKLKDVIKFTGLSRSTIYSLLNERDKRYDPTFPKQVNLTIGRVGWSASEINRWIEHKLVSR
jgi:prophage regulatory protein